MGDRACGCYCDVAVIRTVLVWLKAARSDGVWAFYAKKPLTQPEQVLYFRLVKDATVLAVIALAVPMPHAGDARKSAVGGAPRGAG